MPFWKKKRLNGNGSLEGLIKVRGATQLSDGPTVSRIPPRLIKRGQRSWEPRALGRTMLGASSGWTQAFDYQGSSSGDFYRWLRDSIPIISAGVWAWVRLCATKQTRLIEGSTIEIKRANEALAALDARLLELPYGRGSGFDKLTEAYFLELFTTGKFAGEVILTGDGHAIDHFRFIDPYLISWLHDQNKGWLPVMKRDDGGDEQLDPARFFHGTLGTDLSNPFGVEPLASIPFVAEVEQLMLEDMARSSHNAGTPRLQIKVGRPERFSWEGDNEYINRANNYFNDIVKEFQNLEPDENVFTWGDVEVAMVGGGGYTWNWRLNREQVIEDVITGLKLFPWVLGKTHRSTQNWVQSQFDLLMQMVAAHQKAGSDLVDWICNQELELQGIKARVAHRFDGHPDPFQLERMRAEEIRIRNVDFKVANGYISKDDGARELGYTKAFQKDGE
jgi:hypothetical protein